MTRITLVILACVALAVPAVAQDPAPFKLEPKDTIPPAAPAPGKGDRAGAADEPKASVEDRRQERLNSMFDRLASADNKRRADRIARNIMRRMSRSGSSTVDVLMTQAGHAMKARRLAVALDLLDGVVRIEPEFAEGWNRRATVHYMRGDYSSSLADIEQVLRREPRHWGALAGLSMILVSIDRKSEAVEIMDQALAVHPFLDDMKKKREELVEELEGAQI